MSRKLIIGSKFAYYAYDRQRHRLTARCLTRGAIYTFSGSSLGELKNRLLVIDGHGGRDVFTLVPARSA